MKPEKVQEQKNLAVRGVTDDFLFVTEQASTMAVLVRLHAHARKTGQCVPNWSA